MKNKIGQEESVCLPCRCWHMRLLLDKQLWQRLVRGRLEQLQQQQKFVMNHHAHFFRFISIDWNMIFSDENQFRVSKSLTGFDDWRMVCNWSSDGMWYDCWCSVCMCVWCSIWSIWSCVWGSVMAGVWASVWACIWTDKSCWGGSKADQWQHQLKTKQKPILYARKFQNEMNN